jgi:hypothetical protein
MRLSCLEVPDSVSGSVIGWLQSKEMFIAASPQPFRNTPKLENLCVTQDELLIHNLYLK